MGSIRVLANVAVVYSKNSTGTLAATDKYSAKTVHLQLEEKDRAGRSSACSEGPSCQIHAQSLGYYWTTTPFFGPPSVPIQMPACDVLRTCVWFALPCRLLGLVNAFSY